MTNILFLSLSLVLGISAHAKYETIIEEDNYGWGVDLLKDKTMPRGSKECTHVRMKKLDLLLGKYEMHVKESIKPVVIEAYKKAGKSISVSHIKSKVESVLRTGCLEGAIDDRASGVICPFTGSVVARVKDGRVFEADIAPASMAFYFSSQPEEVIHRDTLGDIVKKEYFCHYGIKPMEYAGGEFGDKYYTESNVYNRSNEVGIGKFSLKAGWPQERIKVREE